MSNEQVEQKTAALVARLEALRTRRAGLAARAEAYCAEIEMLRQARGEMLLANQPSELRSNALSISDAEEALIDVDLQIAQLNKQLTPLEDEHDQLVGSGLRAEVVASQASYDQAYQTLAEAKHTVELAETECTFASARNNRAEIAVSRFDNERARRRQEAAEAVKGTRPVRSLELQRS